MTENQREPVKVFLVDDHALFRAGVRTELDSITDEVQVVGEAGSVAEAVAGIVRTKPQVVLLDVHMPDGGGAEVLRRARLELPDVVFHDRVLQAFSAGLGQVEVEERGHALFAPVGAFDVVMTAGRTEHSRRYRSSLKGKGKSKKAKQTIARD